MTKATPGTRRGNTEDTQRLPLSARDNRILAQRLAYALRHPVTPDAVLIDIKAAELLLQRVVPGEEITEAEDTDT